MSPLALFIFLALLDIQKWATFFEEHEVMIDILSFVIAGATGIIMLMSYLRIRTEKWIKYFAWTFFLLAAQYLYLWFIGQIFPHSSTSTPMPYLDLTGYILLEILSIATNLCGIAGARDIQNLRPLFPGLSKLVHTSAQRGREQALIPRWCWLLAAGALITTVLGYAPQVPIVSDTFHLRYSDHPAYYELLGRSLEPVFSAIALFWLGYVIFANLSNRRHPLNIAAAFLIAVGYAVIQIVLGLSPILADKLINAGTFEERLKVFDYILIGLSLPLKIVLCVFSYRLVVRFFETLNELRTLQDTGFNRREDYLSSGGVVTLISNILRGRIPSLARNKHHEQPTSGIGFVNLAIKLPGETNKRIACIFWPNDAKEKRAIPFDWQSQPMRFSSVYEREQENKGMILELKEALKFAGSAMTKKGLKERIWQEEDFDSRADADSYHGKMAAIVNIAIHAHGAAIGCLQIARTSSPFSQMAIRQIRGIANFLSPAVEAYRELAGLDQMSIRFAQKQAEASTYSSEAAIEEIATILHDIFAPAVTRLQIDFGFSTPPTISQAAKGNEHLSQRMEREFKSKKFEKWPDDLTGEDRIKYRLLKKQLTARVTEAFSYRPQPKNGDRFLMGNLIFAVDDDQDQYDRAALGTTYLHRKTASTLTADAYLDFARDYHNDLLKVLGKELSEKRLNIAEWFGPIERILKHEAGLLWVVVKQRGGKARLGDEAGLSVLRRLKYLKTGMRRLRSVDVPEIQTQYYLKAPSKNKTSTSAEEFPQTRHVLKLRLSSSDGFMWLGVARSGFGPELDFSSPWKTFLVNLAQIADASLSRITFPEKFQVQLEAAQLQGLIQSQASSGLVIHQVRNMIVAQAHACTRLLDDIKSGPLNIEELKRAIRGIYKDAAEIGEIFHLFNSVIKSDDAPFCRLHEVAERAFVLYEVTLTRRGIKWEVNVDESLMIDVPYNVAALALATLVGNSKDAVADYVGKIRIEAERDSDSVWCRVIDNGKGIESEMHDKIFDPKQSTNKNRTGCGLFLTFHSLSDNGSTIELTKSDETGSVFSIRFPLLKESTNVYSSSAGHRSNGEKSFGS